MYGRGLDVGKFGVNAMESARHAIMVATTEVNGFILLLCCCQLDSVLRYLEGAVDRVMPVVWKGFVVEGETVCELL